MSDSDRTGGDIVDPPWFNLHHAEDYSGKDWDYASAMGRSAGALSSMSWHDLEPILQGLWADMRGYPPWEQSRMPMYEAWRRERTRHLDSRR